MIGVEVRGLQQVLGRLERAQKNIDAGERRLVQQGSFQARRRLVGHLSARTAGSDPFWGPKSPAAGPWMRSRSGQTRARLSPGGVVLKTPVGYQAAVGSPDAHMALHETGGTIAGKQFLRIPTSAALTAGGVDRFRGMSARDIPDSFLVRTKAGKLWVVRETGGKNSRKLEFLYLLVRSVTLRPRGIFAAVAKEMDSWMSKEGRQLVTQVVRQANG
jgi:hypothetical protein